MKFNNLVAVSCLAFSGITPALANETTYGIGAAALDFGSEAGGAGIYFPINKGNLLIEPYINMGNYENKSNSVSSSSTYESDYLEIGVGIFKNEKIESNVSMYYGARIAYVSRDYTSSSLTSSYSDELDGYSLTPTIGMQYHFNKNFSLGLDVGYRFEDLSGKTKSTTSPTTDFDYKRQSTESSVLLRYFF